MKLHLLREGRKSSYDQFEELVATNQITYSKASKNQLTRWARGLVETFLEPAKIDWLLGDKEINGVISLKLSHPYLEYLDIDSRKEQFMWCIDNHRDSIPPDHALMILLELETGRKVRQTKLGERGDQGEVWEIQ